MDSPLRIYLHFAFNGTEVAGPDAFFGADGAFWDTLTIDVSPLVAPGDTSATAEITSGTDCLGWIAQVFSVTTDLSYL